MFGKILFGEFGLNSYCIYLFSLNKVILFTNILILMLVYILFTGWWGWGTCTRGRKHRLCIQQPSNRCSTGRIPVLTWSIKIQYNVSFEQYLLYIQRQFCGNLRSRRSPCQSNIDSLCYWIQKELCKQFLKSSDHWQNLAGWTSLNILS